MMRSFLFYTALQLLIFESPGQSIQFTEVVTVDSSIKSSQLYNNAKEWFVRSFKDGNSVVQLDDKEAGKIIGKGNFAYQGKAFTTGLASTGVIHFTVSIESKDGKYRYLFDDFKHESFKGHSYGVLAEDPKGINKSNIRKLKREVTEDLMPGMIVELKKAMIKTTTDW